jgi:hypothetical protein
LFIGTVVDKLDTFLETIKERWRYGKKSISSLAVGNRADVFVHAEYLLNNNQPGDRFTNRHRDVHIEHMAIARLHSH